MKKQEEASIIVKNLEKTVEIAKSCENHFPIQFDIHYCSVSDAEYLDGLEKLVEMLKDPASINATEIVYVKAMPYYVIVKAKIGEWEIAEKSYDVCVKDFDRVKRDLKIDLAGPELANILVEQGFEVSVISPKNVGNAVVTKPFNGHVITIEDFPEDEYVLINISPTEFKVGAISDVSIAVNRTNFKRGFLRITDVLENHGLGNLIGDPVEEQ